MMIKKFFTLIVMGLFIHSSSIHSMDDQEGLKVQLINHYNKLVKLVGDHYTLNTSHAIFMYKNKRCNSLILSHKFAPDQVPFFLCNYSPEDLIALANERDDSLNKVLGQSEIDQLLGNDIYRKRTDERYLQFDFEE